MAGIAGGRWWTIGKDAVTLRLHHAACEGSFPWEGERMRAAAGPIWWSLVLMLFSCADRACGEIDLPIADARAPITVTAQQAQRWQEGQYLVWLLHGQCEIQQGPVSVRGADAVLWVDRGDPVQHEPSKIIAYLEQGVTIDCAQAGQHRSATTPGTQPVQGRSWLGRFHTTAGIDIRAPLAGPQPDARPPMVQRSMEALDWTQRSTVQPAQYLSPAPSPAAVPQREISARSVSIRSRSSVPMQAKSFPSRDPQETIVTVTSGVQIIVGGIENVPGVQTGVVTIEADRVVIWTTAMAGLIASSQSIEQAGGRWEFYLEGNIIFREGDRVVYADRMYYNVNLNQGTILNAEMLTPVPQYDGLVRLKADVLQQVDQQRFLAFGGALTSSRLGVPSYWFQSERVSFEDVQRLRMDPFTGQPAVDPVTGEPAVSHELQAQSNNNLIYFGGVPLLYWPMMATDLTKPNFYIDQVRFGDDRVFGTQVMVDWDLYQILGIREPPDGTRWSMSTDWLSQRGFGFGTEFAYERNGCLGLPGPAVGRWDAWGISDDGFDNLGADRLALFPESELRGRVLGKHRQQLPDGFQFTGEFGYISDRNFLEQYFEYEWDELKDQTTGVDLKRYVGNRSWDLVGDVRINDFFTQTEWLPRFDHFLLGESLLDDRLTWMSHSQVGYGHLQIISPPDPINPVEVATYNLRPWEVESEGLRAATRQEVDWPFELGAVKIVPYALGEIGYWGEVLNGEDLARAYGQAGIRTSVPFWRVDAGVQSLLLNLNGLAHKVSLDADFFWADANQNVGDFPLYDPLDDDENEHFRRRFTTYTFGGAIPPPFDERSYALRTGLQRWVTAPSTEIVDDLWWTKLGVRQRWQTKRGAPGRERVVDWITLDVEGVLFPDDQRDDFDSPFGLFNYDCRWHVGDRLTLLSDGFADFFDDGLQTVMIGSQITRPERGNMFVGYRWVEGPITSQLLQASVAYRMTDKWIVTAGAVVDTTDTGNIGQSVDLTRIGESLLMRVGFNVDTSRDNVGLNLSIEPRFLPRHRLGRMGGIQIPPPGVYGLE